MVKQESFFLLRQIASYEIFCLLLLSVVAVSAEWKQRNNIWNVLGLNPSTIKSEALSSIASGI